MSYQELRQAVYWLPDMASWEYTWGFHCGFEHKFAHVACWNGLKDKRKALIRLCAYKNQEPRSMGQLV